VHGELTRLGQRSGDRGRDESGIIDRVERHEAFVVGEVIPRRAPPQLPEK
jgi:hypothetical protein